METIKKFIKACSQAFSNFFKLESWISSNPYYDKADEALRKKEGR